MIEGPVLVLSPHPDDDVIGCGGLIAKCVAAGDRVRVVYLTSGELGAPGTDPPVVLEWRERDARRAADLLGLEGVAFWEQPDGALVATDDLVARLADELATFRPRTLLVPHALDDHPDHRAAYELVDRAVAFTRALQTIDVLTYEVWTPMPRYDHVVDITDYIDITLAAIRQHESQVSRIRFDEAKRCLAWFRGTMHNRPHGEYAEVFGRFPMQ